MSGSKSLSRIAVLLTCHNRREKTVRCLKALREQEGASLKFDSHYSINIFLVDDGCTDGTAEAVLNIWPDATVIKGDGNLYWCGGMRRAWVEAAKSDPDFYLLLNDDTFLFPNAIESLLILGVYPSLPFIVVGAIIHPETSKQQYGGIINGKRFPIPAVGYPVVCDTMHGNCVLVSRATYQKNSILYHAYTHAMGDLDYGNQARKKGGLIIQTAFPVGVCSRNSNENTWRDTKLSRKERLGLLWSKKNLPPLEWLTYCRRNMGFLWPRYFVSPMLRILLGK